MHARDFGEVGGFVVSERRMSLQKAVMAKCEATMQSMLYVWTDCFSRESGELKAAIMVMMMPN